MIVLSEIIEYAANCKRILGQISKYGDNLEFETWVYSDTIKINDTFWLNTPDIHFEVKKYNILGKTPYCFSLYGKASFMTCPKHSRLFNRIFAPIIFKACKHRYKQTGKQK